VLTADCSLFLLNLCRKKTLGQLKSWKPNESRERGTLLIVDRSIDAVAPLMHEYTFQAMTNDLLKVKGELCYLKSEEKENANRSEEEEKAASALVLSEDDDLWVDFRHKHIGEVMHTVNEQFRQFKGQNKLAKIQSDSENVDVKDMLSAMKDMPQYKAMMKKYHKHMSLAEDCMKKFDKRKLKELGELEQDMATGLTNDGKAVVVKSLKNQLVKMCQDNSISVLDRLRLLMIYIISQGAIQDATRKELMKDIHQNLHKAIRNLEKLGVDLNTINSSNKSKHNKDRLAEFAKRNKTIPLALMRYLPALQATVEQLVTGELDEESFPYIPSQQGVYDKKSSGKSAASSARSVRKKAAGGAAGDWKSNGKDKDKDENKDAEEETRPRFIIFVIGGLTFSEMRSAYELAEQHKASIYIGSTSTITANDYIKDLSDLNKIEFRESLKQSQSTAAEDSGESSDDNGEADDEDFDKIKLNFHS
jgi:syntaxin-binding protein 1